MRAAPLALALQEDYEVEVLGLLLSGTAVHAPYRDLFDYRTIRSSPLLPAMLASIPRLAAMARGDVLYACKPLLSTLGTAWFGTRGGSSAAVLLDVEDDEWASTSTDTRRSPVRELAEALFLGTHRSHARLLHPLTKRVHGVSVSSTRLQARYGGVVVRHGPDERLFDPRRTDLGNRNVIRTRFGLPLHRKLALFAGVPRAHKGWETLLNALSLPAAEEWDLVLAGGADYDGFHQALQRLGSRCHLVGIVPRVEMPVLLSATDAVPTPLLPTSFAESQLPAKVLDAMAMEVPVIGTHVGDLPEILGGGERGWLCRAGEPEELAQLLARIAGSPGEAGTRARAGREWFLREASGSVARHRLRTLVEEALRKKRGGG